MEKATVERVNITTVDVRAAGKYIPNAELTSGIKIETVGIGDVVLIEVVDGKYYVIALVSSGGAVPEDKMAAWMPKHPVSLAAIVGEGSITFKWDWGDTTRMLPYLDGYTIDVRQTGGTWGYREFPIDVGASKTVTVVLQNGSYEWRVRANSIYSISSEWATYDSFVTLETIYPEIDPPTSLAADPREGGAMLTWEYETVPPYLDGFVIFKSAESDGSSPSKIVKLPATTREWLAPCGPYELNYYNIVAYDVGGNISAFGDTWVEGYAAYIGGENLIPNSDFEMDSDGDGTADGWYDAPSSVTWGNYGIGGGKGYELDPAVPTTIPTAAFLLWDPARNGYEIEVTEGQYVVVSLYIKPDFTPFAYVPQSKITGCTPSILYSDGSTVKTNALFSPVEGDVSGYEVLADGWVRSWLRHRVTADDVDGTPYIGVAAAMVCMGGDRYCYVDRIKLEFGFSPTAWGTSVTQVFDGTNLTGLRIDSSGIVGDDIVIRADGRVGSDLEPGADDTYWLGSDQNWKGLTLKDGITAPSGVSGDAKLFVDTSDSKLKVRHGTATPVSLEEQGTGPIDSNMAVNSSWVSISTSWTTLTSLAITVPTGYRAMVGASVTLRGDSTVTQQIEHVSLYDGTSSFQQSDVLVGGTDTVCQIGMTWYTIKTGSYTIYLRAQKGDSNNTVGADAYRALLTVFIYEEKT